MYFSIFFVFLFFFLNNFSKLLIYLLKINTKIFASQIEYIYEKFLIFVNKYISKNKNSRNKEILKNKNYKKEVISVNRLKSK